MTCCQEATGSEFSFLFFWLETFVEFQKEPEGQDIFIHRSVLARKSGSRRAGRDQSLVSPLPVVVYPRVATALLKAQQRCTAAADLSGAQTPSRSWICPTQLTLPLSFPGVFFPHCPISSGLGLCSFLERLPSCYSDDDNNGYHLLSTYLCQTPC